MPEAVLDWDTAQLLRTEAVRLRSEGLSDFDIAQRLQISAKLVSGLLAGASKSQVDPSHRQDIRDLEEKAARAAQMLAQGMPRRFVAEKLGLKWNELRKFMESCGFSVQSLLKSKKPVDKLSDSGRFLLYRPYHPHANDQGMVARAVVVMEEFLAANWPDSPFLTKVRGRATLLPTLKVVHKRMPGTRLPQNYLDRIEHLRVTGTVNGESVSFDPYIDLMRMRVAQRRNGAS